MDPVAIAAAAIPSCERRHARLSTTLLRIIELVGLTARLREDMDRHPSMPGACPVLLFPSFFITRLFWTCFFPFFTVGQSLSQQGTQPSSHLTGFREAPPPTQGSTHRGIGLLQTPTLSPK